MYASILLLSNTKYVFLTPTLLVPWNVTPKAFTSITRESLAIFAE